MHCRRLLSALPLHQCVDAGAHIIGIKDMAGLLKPLAAEPLMRAIREVSSLDCFLTATGFLQTHMHHGIF